MSDCDYCRGVGACPKCWGRANIEELKAQRDTAVRLLREFVRPGATDVEWFHLTAEVRAFLETLK